MAENMQPEEKKMEEGQTTESTGAMTAEERKDKQIKNLAALAIVLGGLFLGSLFVDVFQLFAGRGYSERALKKADVVEMAGKTWVAYADPKVTVKVLTDTENCENCDPDQALLALRRVMPTLEAKEVDIDTTDGKSLREGADVISVPAFFFAPEVEKTSIFAQAEPLFQKQESGWYFLDASKLGLPAGKYLSLPEVTDGDMVWGNKDAKVKIVEYSDYQCPFCRALHTELKPLLQEYKDKVLYVYKHYPLPFHAQAESAALATACANDQGKFFEYGDLLFQKQDEWGKTTGVGSFKTYARTLGLNAATFNECLDSKKHLEKVNADKAEGEKFGISGTPGTFVGGTFFGGAVGADQLKTAIDAELAK